MTEEYFPTSVCNFSHGVEVDEKLLMGGSVWIASKSRVPILTWKAFLMDKLSSLGLEWLLL